MNLGTVIKDIRKQRGQTQTEFADSCGITQTYLSQIENNAKEPNLSTLKEISKNLDLPLPILFYLSLNEDDISLLMKMIFLQRKEKRLKLLTHP
ncbi:helix-turn-helix domain-containing protein [Elizabethkingia ursingii]